MPPVDIKWPGNNSWFFLTDMLTEKPEATAEKNFLKGTKGAVSSISPYHTTTPQDN